MESRNKTLANMVKAAELTIIRAYEKNNRVCIDARAENGMEETFALSNRRGDIRGELNENARIKRFARMNMLYRPDPEEETVATLNLPKGPMKLEAVTTTAERELTMREFYKLCELVKTRANMSPDAEALALEASKTLGVPISVDSIAEAMEAAGIAEPAAWKPLDPTIVLAAELRNLMTALGQTPSAHFSRLLKTLETA